MYYKQQSLKDFEGEIWKQIAGFENYMISNFGRFKSLARIVQLGPIASRYQTEKILYQRINKQTLYPQVTISVKCKFKTFNIHRLVGLYFIPNPENLPDLNHIDGDGKNCHYSNLEWCTTQYNILYTSRVLKIRKSNCKFSEVEILKIRSLQGSLKSHEAASIFNCTPSMITAIWRKERYAMVE